MNGDQDNTSQDPDPDRQQQQQQQQRQAIGGYAEDGLEDGSLATRESAFLEGGGGGAEVRVAYVTVVLYVCMRVAQLVRRTK